MRADLTRKDKTDNNIQRMRLHNKTADCYISTRTPLSL